MSALAVLAVVAAVAAPAPRAPVASVALRPEIPWVVAAVAVPADDVVPADLGRLAAALDATLSASRPALDALRARGGHLALELHRDGLVVVVSGHESDADLVRAAADAALALPVDNVARVLGDGAGVAAVDAGDALLARLYPRPASAVDVDLAALWPHLRAKASVHLEGRWSDVAATAKTPPVPARPPQLMPPTRPARTPRPLRVQPLPPGAALRDGDLLVLLVEDALAGPGGDAEARVGIAASRDAALVWIDSGLDDKTVRERLAAKRGPVSPKDAAALVARADARRARARAAVGDTARAQARRALSLGAAAGAVSGAPVPAVDAVARARGLLFPSALVVVDGPAPPAAATLP